MLYVPFVCHFSDVSQSLGGTSVNVVFVKLYYYISSAMDIVARTTNCSVSGYFAGEGAYVVLVISSAMDTVLTCPLSLLLQNDDCGVWPRGEPISPREE